MANYILFSTQRIFVKLSVFKAKSNKQKDKNLEKDPYVDDNGRRETRKFGVRIIGIYFMHAYLYMYNSYINNMIYIIT